MGIATIFLGYLVAALIGSDLLGNILSPLATLLATFYVLKGFVQDQSIKGFHRSAVVGAMGIFIWFLCDVWWLTSFLMGYNPENIYVLMSAYSLTNFFFMISLIFLILTEFKKWNGIQLAADSIFVSICILIMIWVIFFDKNVNNLLLIKSDRILAISLFSDFVTAIWTGIWFFSIRIGKAPLYLICLLIGLASFVTADITYYYLYFFHSYDPNSLIDVWYLYSFGLMGLGGYLRYKYGENVTNDRRGNIGGKGKEVILLVAPVTIIIFKGMELPYVISILVIILLYFILTNFIQKNAYNLEIMKIEKQLIQELEQKVAERTKEVIKLLNVDVVTDLYSRRYFYENMEKMLKEMSPGEKVMLFYIEQNKFKMIKTMYGNYVAEMTLKEIGKKLKKIKHNGILASYGEDTFVLAMKGYYMYKDGFQMAEEIIDECSNLYTIENHDIVITLNIGISIYPIDAKNLIDLIKNADIAMEQGKKSGFNKVMAFDKELGEMICYRNDIEMKLKNAKFDKEFQLYYQPQVDCMTGKLIGFEALIRWKKDNNKIVLPGEFIPISEETGMIINIGYWVMHEAISQVAKWRESGYCCPRIAINVSAKQLFEGGFINVLSRAMEGMELPPDRIEIEITESIQLEESAEIRNCLKKISDLGISIAIDDFGTGYSSLYYLKNLPINRIKIAKPLIDNIDKDEYDYNIVKTAIGFAKLRGIKVIAEGVEKKEQLECLQELECDEIQGYYFAKPMPAQDAFENWIKKCKVSE